MEHIKHVMHGESKTRLYRIWSNLKNRVLPNSAKSKYYFDRGIGLCEEWKNSFESFKDWSINNGYNDKLTLDRINNDGNYCPDNCRWADMKTQANNRSNNIIVYADKESIPLSEICRVLNIDYKTAYGKVVRHLAMEDNLERIGKNRKEESVSNPIDFEKELYKAFGQVKDFTLGMRIAKWFYDMGKNSQEPVSEELEEELSKLLKECDVDAEYVHQDFLHIVACHFANWQKQQMTANATKVTVHIDAGGYPYIPEIELYDYDKDVPLAKEGDKYKVILIKEE